MKISKSSILSIMKIIVENTQFKSEGIVEGCIEFEGLYTNDVAISEILNSEYKLSVDEIKSGLYILDTLGLIKFESADDKSYKSVILTEKGYSFYLNFIFTDVD